MGVLLTLLALLLVGGCGGDSAGSGPEPEPTTQVCEVASSSGEFQAPVLRATLAGSWDENWLASPSVADVDGDGSLDIIAARHSVLYLWHGDGTPMWKTAWANSASNTPEHGNSRMWASPVVADFDRDGDVEIAVGSDADSSDQVNVAVYDHLGELLSGFPVQFGGSDEVRSITAGDVDDDGNLEVIVNKTNQGPTTAVYELSGAMASGWPQVSPECNPDPPAEACWDFGGYNQNVATGDVDLDGVFDVVSSYDAIGFGIFYGDGSPFLTHESFSDRVVTATEAYHDYALAQQGWGTGDRSEFTGSPPVIADIDQNGDLEIVLAGDHEHSQDTTLQGVALWVFNPDLTRPEGWETPITTGAPLATGVQGHNIVVTQPSPAVADIHEAAGLEILVPAYDGLLYAFSAKGIELWTYSFGSASPYVGAGEPTIADLNGDGHPEVIFTTFSAGMPREPEAPAHLIALAANGSELAKVELFGRGSMAAPTIVDLDGDGDLEIILSLKDSLGDGEGGVQIWDVPGSSDNCILWGTGRGGALRQGYIKP